MRAWVQASMHACRVVYMHVYVYMYDRFSLSACLGSSMHACKVVYMHVYVYERGLMRREWVGNDIQVLLPFINRAHVMLDMQVHTCICMCTCMRLA